jgi:hypothetical protein
MCCPSGIALTVTGSTPAKANVDANPHECSVIESRVEREPVCFDLINWPRRLSQQSDFEEIAPVVKGHAALEKPNVGIFSDEPRENAVESDIAPKLLVP